MIYESYPEVSADFDDIFNRIYKPLENHYMRELIKKKTKVPTTSLKLVENNKLIDIRLKAYQTKFEVSREDIQKVDLFYIRTIFYRESYGSIKERLNDFMKHLEENGLVFKPGKTSFMDWFIRILNASVIEEGNSLDNLYLSKATKEILSKKLQERGNDYHKLMRWHLHFIKNDQHR